MEYEEYEFWAPVLFSYLYASYFCHLLDKEYQYFMSLKMRYSSDPLMSINVPTQVYYTVLIECIPVELQSAYAMKNMIDNVFKG